LARHYQHKNALEQAVETSNEKRVSFSLLMPISANKNQY